jgi:muconolactone delta-isomerase
MEFLVDMTTQVPAGTAEEAVGDVRAREAARSAELVAQGHLLRLWRPPLGPGEWRTLGLFAAEDGGRLEKVLASMPLRVWRSDKVTPLWPHPNDPGRADRGPFGPEYLVLLTIIVPPGTAGGTVDEVTAAEAGRARQLAAQGHLARLWGLTGGPGPSQVLGLWRARGPAELQTVLESLPVYPWTTSEVTPLSPHPSDPVASMAG